MAEMLCKRCGATFEGLPVCPMCNPCPKCRSSRMESLGGHEVTCQGCGHIWTWNLIRVEHEKEAQMPRIPLICPSCGSTKWEPRAGAAVTPDRPWASCQTCGNQWRVYQKGETVGQEEVGQYAKGVAEAADNWRHRSKKMRCATCMWFVPKVAGKIHVSTTMGELGRCRKRAPTLNGWPAVYGADWCGDHKIDEGKA